MLLTRRYNHHHYVRRNTGLLHCLWYHSKRKRLRPNFNIASHPHGRPLAQGEQTRFAVKTIARQTHAEATTTTNRHVLSLSLLAALRKRRLISAANRALPGRRSYNIFKGLMMNRIVETGPVSEMNRNPNDDTSTRVLGAGQWKGKIKIADDFDELPDDLLKLFTGEAEEDESFA
jgi:hypothetical protein